MRTAKSYGLRSLLCALAFSWVVFFVGTQTANAAPMQCLDLFSVEIQAAPSVEEKQRALWDSNFKERVSPGYKEIWESLAKNYHPLFLQLKRIGAPEIVVFEKLGFVITETAIIAPTLDVFIQNYTAYLDAKKIPEHLRIYPSLAFRSKTTQELRMIRPEGHNRDAWPNEHRSRWGLSSDERLTPMDIIKNVSEGRWPMFSGGFHDVFHFITFAMYPEYAGALRSLHADFPLDGLTNSLLNRSAYATEILALAKREKASEIKSHLSFVPQKSATFADFENAVNSLSAEQLADKAHFWRANFQKYVRHYAGGMAEPLERGRYNDHPSLNISFFYGGHLQYINRPVMPDAMITEGLSHLDIYLQRLIDLQGTDAMNLNYVFSGRNPDGAVELNRLLRLQIARMEYALWYSSTQLTVKQWLNDTLVLNADPNSKTMQFIKDVFGEDSISYRLMLDRP